MEGSNGLSPRFWNPPLGFLGGICVAPSGYRDGYE